MRPIPEYFVALVKQYANLRSNQEAEQLVQTITILFDANIDPKRSVYLFSLLPSYLRPRSQKFFARLVDWQPRYKHARTLDRLQACLQLTDRVEVAMRLKAYFKAIKVVVEPSDRLKIARALPEELNQIYIKA